ncbi:NAD-dependent epimerase/dehydratase family protein [Dongia sp.]|jgi:UDP-glucuronate 4-epimerase|uniref:NAD-dependent epimerase/dehydratase family protein n=1 Tax=Dongia sp. TaxID=1977262 RepID=UPI0035B0AB5F
MTILVTGVAGFIGYHVAEALLTRGERVLGLDNMNPYYDTRLKQARLHRLERHPHFSYVFADIGRAPALNAAIHKHSDTITGIIHLAAQAGVRHSIDHPADYVGPNLSGHLNILELGRHLPQLQHLVYASSSSVYGNTDRVPFAIDDPVDRPASLYAATKRADELMSIAYAQLYRLPLTGLRFFTVIGPWGRPDMAYYRFTQAILAGEKIEVFGDGSVERDFTYIDDIVAGILSALGRPPSKTEAMPHRLYNLGSDRPVSLNHLIDLIEQACGRKATRNVHAPAAGDVKATWADLTLSRADLGYEPSTSLSDAIEKFVAWYREYAKI